MATNLVYAAFRSVPDYTAPTPPLLSLHETLGGAIKALYPDRQDFRDAFRMERSPNGERYWNGPDGFGLVKEMVVKS
jgi:hypothetical protein